jgi:hypothetical protein
MLHIAQGFFNLPGAGSTAARAKTPYLDVAPEGDSGVVGPKEGSCAFEILLERVKDRYGEPERGGVNGSR